MNALVDYLRRPDVTEAPIRSATHRVCYELRRLLAPDTFDRCHTFTAGDGYTVTANLSDAIGKSLYIYGAYEWVAGRVLSSLVDPGDIVVDAGAHIGAHTIPLAKSLGPAGRLFAFEPDPDNRALLRKNISDNQLHNVDVLPLALFDRQTTMSLHRTRRRNSGAIRLTSGDGVSCRRLDGVLNDDVEIDLLKIDVEGFELLFSAVHRPATVQRNLPFIFFELNNVASERNWTDNETIRLLYNWGYTLFGAQLDHGNISLEPLREETDPNRYREPWHPLNLVAIHNTASPRSQSMSS